jgi:mannosyltransferase
LVDIFSDSIGKLPSLRNRTCHAPLNAAAGPEVIVSRMSPPLPSAARKSAWSLAALGLIALIGAALRLWQTRESLWLDELHTAWCALGSLAEVAPRAAIGNQSPLFFWFEWLLVRLLGPSELTLRLPSVLAGSLLPVVIYGLCRRWGQSSGISLLAAALIVIDPLSIFFATEARPYALIQLLATLHIGVAAERFERPSPVLRILFVVGAVLLFHLHYTAALLLAAELALWVILAMNQPSSGRFRPAVLLVDWALIGLCCLPASHQLSAIFLRRANWKAFVPERSLGQPWELFDVLPWSYAALGLAVILLAQRIHSYGNRLQPADGSNAGKQARFRLLALCWFAVPVLSAWLATTTGLAHLYFPRYLAASAPATMLLAVLCVAAVPSRRGRLALGMSVLGLAIWLSGILPQIRLDGRIIGDRREDWRSAIAWLNSRLASKPTSVLVDSGLIEARELRGPHEPLLEEYCLFPVNSLYPIAADRSALSTSPLPSPHGQMLAFLSQTHQRGEARLIVRGRNPVRAALRAARLLLVETRTAASVSESELVEHIGQTKSFGNVHIFTISLEPGVE